MKHGGANASSTRRRLTGKGRLSVSPTGDDCIPVGTKHNPPSNRKRRSCVRRECVNSCKYAPSHREPCQCCDSKARRTRLVKSGFFGCEDKDKRLGQVDEQYPEYLNLYIR